MDPCWQIIFCQENPISVKRLKTLSRDMAVDRKKSVNTWQNSEKLCQGLTENFCQQLTCQELLINDSSEHFFFKNIFYCSFPWFPRTFAPKGVWSWFGKRQTKYHKQNRENYIYFHLFTTLQMGVGLCSTHTI